MSNKTSKQEQSQQHTTNSASEDQNNSNSSTIKIKGADGQEHEYDVKDKLIERVPIQNTDFEIVGNNELGWILTLGKFKLTEPTPNIEEVHKFLIEQPWKVTLRLTYAVVKAIQQENIEQLKTNN